MDRPEIYELLELANGNRSPSYKLEAMTNLLLERLVEIQAVEAIDGKEVQNANS